MRDPEEVAVSTPTNEPSGATNVPAPGQLAELKPQAVELGVVVVGRGL